MPGTIIQVSQIMHIDEMMGQSLSVQLIIVLVCNHLQPKEMESSDDSTCCSAQFNIPFMYFQKNIISSAKRIYCALI